MNENCDACSFSLELLYQKEEECLKKYGWYTHFISNDPTCPFNVNFHSHGFGYKFHPDVQICAPAPQDVLHKIMNIVYGEIEKGVKFLPGKRYSNVLTDLDVTFIEINENLLRIILPDLNNNLDKDKISGFLKKQYD